MQKILTSVSQQQSDSQNFTTHNLTLVRIQLNTNNEKQLTKDFATNIMHVYVHKDCRQANDPPATWRYHCPWIIRHKR